MGGSGGGFRSQYSPTDSARKIREAENESLDKEFDASVNEYLNSELSVINDRPVEAINQHLDTIDTSLHAELEGLIKLTYGGSVAKHTYVDGLSDIDSLAVLNSTELSTLSPQQVLKYFEGRLKTTLPNTEIWKGRLAVTVKFSDGIEIQILPAIKTATGYKIAASDGSDRWSNVINPRGFAGKLTQINQLNDRKMVPVIKLAKAIISTFPEKRQLSGYHTESLAIDIFKDYQGQKQTKAMLKHFFDEASKRVNSKIRDSTNQSLHVDDYLGANNSTERRMVSDSLSQIFRKMSNADANRQITHWRSLLK